jgi:SAM-dependent methyltransferase
MEKANAFNQNYSRYYNLFYSEKNYGTEVSYVDKLIRKFSNGGKTILEYGSGTGGHGVLFGELGYEVTGIERSQEMAAIAKQRGLNCVTSDITRFNLDKKFDICLALFHVISYVNDNDSIIKVFENTKRHLAKGGVFIFDAWFTPAVMNQVPEVRVKKLESDDSKIMRIAEPVIDYQKNVVDVKYHVVLQDKGTGKYTEFDESHPMRHFGIPEIELIAMQTGFTLLHTEEFHTGEKPSSKTWGVTFILEVNE